ncbi:hypothetical protein Bca4012_063272 [Brassica carinata]
MLMLKSLENPYVLCRLFHKPSDVTNCDKVENANSTLTPTRCSHEDNSSAMVQETAASHHVHRHDDTEICLSDKGSDVKPDDDPVIKTEKSVHHAETSRTKDYVFGKRLVESSIVFAASHMDSMYSSDFENHDYGLFEDGAAIQDESLTDVLDEVFHNHNHNQSSSQGKDFALPNMMHWSAEYPFPKETVGFVNGGVEAACPQDAVEIQSSSESSRTLTQHHSNVLGQYAPASYAAMDPFNSIINHREQSSFEQSPVDSKISPSDIPGFKARPMENQTELDSIVSQSTGCRVTIRKREIQLCIKKMKYSLPCPSIEENEKCFIGKDMIRVQGHECLSEAGNLMSQGTVKRRSACRRECVKFP